MNPDYSLRVRTKIRGTLSAITDVHGGIEDLVAEGDKVACRLSGDATHKGDLLGVAATGGAITVTGIAIYRIASGEIQEEWDYPDVPGLVQQLGVGHLQGYR